MKYIELIILVCVYINLLIILYASYIARIRVKWYMLLISSCLYGFYLYWYIKFPKYAFSYHYFIFVGLGIISFIPSRKILTGFIIYLLLNLSLGGTDVVIYRVENSFYITISVMLVMTIVFFLIHRIKLVPLNRYRLSLEYENKRLDLVGFYDSGNFLTYKGLPVVVVSYKYDIGKAIGIKDIRTVSGCSTLLIYEVDRVILKANKKKIIKKCYVAYSDIKADAMFGSSLLGG